MTDDIELGIENSANIFRPTVVLIAETTAVMSFFSLISSIVVMYFKFIELDLRVWEIVTPQDMLVSGLDTLIALLAIAIYCYLMFVFITKILKITKMPTLVYFILLVFFVFTGLILMILNFRNDIDLSRDQSLLFLFFACLAMIPPCFHLSGKSLNLNIFVVALIFIIMLSVTTSFLNSRSRQGTLWMATYSDGSLIRSCYYPGVVWIGVESVLIECGNNGFRRNKKEFVMLARDQVRLLDLSLYMRNGYFRRNGENAQPH